MAVDIDATMQWENAVFGFAPRPWESFFGNLVGIDRLQRM